MEAYQLRVVEEKKELDEKIDKLTGFTASSSFYYVVQSEQERLKRQLVVMKEYSYILGQRIANFA